MSSHSLLVILSWPNSGNSSFNEVLVNNLREFFEKNQFFECLT